MSKLNSNSGYKGKKKRMNKKATINDLLPIMLFALVFGIMCFAGFKVYNEFNDSYTPTSAVGVSILGKVPATMNLLDNLFMFFIVALGITVIVAAIRIRTSPGFFFISVLLLATMIFLSAQLSNVFEKVSNDETFATEKSTFNLMSDSWGQMPINVLAIGFLVLIALYTVNKIVYD